MTRRANCPNTTEFGPVTQTSYRTEEDRKARRNPVRTDVSDDFGSCPSCGTAVLRTKAGIRKHLPPTP